TSTENRFSTHPSPAALGGTLAAHQADRLPFRENDQDLPQIVTIIQSGKSLVPGTLQKGVKCGEDHIFFVGDAFRRRAQPATGDPDETPQVAFPESLRHFLITGFEPHEPLGNRIMAGDSMVLNWRHDTIISRSPNGCRLPRKTTGRGEFAR